MKLFVYRHRDDPLKVACAESGAPLITLWLFGYEMKPVYAINVKWRKGCRP